MSVQYTSFIPVVPFDRERDHLYPLDLSVANSSLAETTYGDLDRFCAFINETLRRSGARYLVGGYGELRKIYSFSHHFDGDAEPRRLHLGLDVWGPAGTEVYSIAAGRLHSAAWNGAKGDYGGTVIVQHEGRHTLYGHLSKGSIKGKQKGDIVQAGDLIGTLGVPSENGGWPPHLHFQVILDMQGMEGDYPGVCRQSEKDLYLANCPDPEALLQWRPFIRS
jgi:peptidoglycan LD-endopeptidase LytH